jgi:uncharacterized membrane protein HdeD (DUF308 family)
MKASSSRSVTSRLQSWREDPADIMARVGRHWGWLLAFGIITVLVGLAALVWPGRTLVVIAVLFGIQLIVMGIFRFASAFAADETSGTRVLLALLGVLSLIIGLYAVRHLFITILALALLLGIFWIVSGTVELFTSISHRQMRGRGWTALTGVLGIVSGLILLAVPGISLLVLALVISIWLLVFGFMEITAAFRIRSLRA